MLATVFSIVAIAAGLLSAALWCWASAVKMPARVWIQAGVGGGRPSEDVDKLVDGLRWQSQLNGAAAFCAAVAAAGQALAMIVK